MGKAAHRLDHPEVVIGVLPIRFRHDPIAGRSRFTGQRLVFVEYLMGIAAHTHVGTAAVEDLVPIWRTIGIVMLLVMAATAATTAAATRPLTIVWSH